MLSRNTNPVKNRKSLDEELSIGMKNRILYGLMYAEEVPITVMAEKLDVSSEKLAAWCYFGELPDEDIRKKLADYFDLPEQILFWEAEH